MELGEGAGTQGKDMKPGHGAGTWSWDTELGHGAETRNRDMELGHGAGTQQGHRAGTQGRDTEPGQGSGTLVKDMKAGHGAGTWSWDTGQGHEARTWGRDTWLAGAAGEAASPRCPGSVAAAVGHSSAPQRCPGRARAAVRRRPRSSSYKGSSNCLNTLPAPRPRSPRTSFSKPNARSHTASLQKATFCSRKAFRGFSLSSSSASATQDGTGDRASGCRQPRATGAAVPGCSHSDTGLSWGWGCHLHPPTRDARAPGVWLGHPAAPSGSHRAGGSRTGWPPPKAWPDPVCTLTQPWGPQHPQGCREGEPPTL